MKLTDFIEMKPITRGWSKEKSFMSQRRMEKDFYCVYHRLKPTKKRRFFLTKLVKLLNWIYL